jgi:hypothetical protein
VPPDAFRLIPEKEAKTISARLLKLPMMNAKAPTYRTFLANVR